MKRFLVLFLMLASTVGAITPSWRQVLIRDNQHTTYPKQSHGGQHPQSIQLCRDEPTYGAFAIDCGSMRTFTFDSTGLIVTYPQLKGLLAGNGQSIGVHPTDHRILLYWGDCWEWEYALGATPGIYKSTDYGDNWTRKSTYAPNYGFQAWPLSTSTIAYVTNTNTSSQRRANHDWFVYKGSDPTKWWACRNQLYQVTLTVTDLTTVPEYTAWDRDTSNLTSRSVVTGSTHANAWLAVTSASTTTETITGFVNYTEYFTNGSDFHVGDTITAKKVGGAASAMAGTLTVTAVDVDLNKSSWLFYSADTGDTWTPVTDSVNTGYWMQHSKGLWLNAAGTYLYYWGYNGLFSYQIGTPFALTQLYNGDITDFEVDPTDEATMYVTVADSTGVCKKSVDSGANWSTITTATTGEKLLCIAVDPTDRTKGYMLREYSYGNKYTTDMTAATPTWTGNFYQMMNKAPWSIPSGTTTIQTWTDQNGPMHKTMVSWNGIYAPRYGRTCEVKYHPTNGNYLFGYGDACLWYSLDAGRTWTMGNKYTGEAPWTGDSYGFSTGDNNTWGIGIADFFSVLITHDNGKSWEMGGYYDYKQLWTNTPSVIPVMSAWHYGVNVAFDPANSNNVICGFGSGGAVRFAKSTDGGKSFSLIDNTQVNVANAWIKWHPTDSNRVSLGGLTSADAGATMSLIDTTGCASTAYQIKGVSSDNPDIWYALGSSTRYIAKSTNKGVTWANLYDLGVLASDIAFYNDDVIYYVDGSPASPYYRDLVWSTSVGVWVTTGGIKNLSGDYSAYGNYVQEVAVDPRNHNVAYILLRLPGIEKIWMTIDHGANWTNITGNLNRAYVMGIAVKPTGELLCGGEFGTWVYPAYDSTKVGDSPLWDYWAEGVYDTDPAPAYLIAN
jgi:hypothetical protein